MQGKIESISEPIDVIIGNNIKLGKKIKIKVSNKVSSKKFDQYIKNDVIHYDIGDEIFFESRNLTEAFGSRLKKIGINVQLGGNFPWIYLDKINDVKVEETYQARHGFAAFFLTQHPLDERKINFTTKIRFSDRKEVFKLIRKYLEKQ
jgi:hypothetical protein